MNKHVIKVATMPLIVAGIAGAIVSPVFAEGPEPRPCAELQDAINAAPDDMQASIFVTGDCSGNILIPSHKNIFVDFGGGFHSNELIDFNGDEYGDTITVEEGAFVYLSNGTLVNGSDGRTIIKNSGLTVVDVNLTADNGAYSIINNGEVNIVETTAVGFRVDNSGILRIGHGYIDNEEAAEPYVTGAINVDIGSDGQPDFLIPDTIPVGYKATLQYRNPAFAATNGSKISSENNEILSITGSALEGYRLEAKSVGMVGIGGTTWLTGSGGMALIYNVESNTPDLVNNSVLKYLVGRYGYSQVNPENTLAQALANDETISVDLNIDELDAEDIDEEDAAKINEVLGDGEVLAYGDISLAINASESGLIEEVAFLGGCGSTSEPGAEPVCTEDPIDVKWGGLELGEPAAGYERNFFAIRLHDGKAEKIAAEVDKDGNLVFPSGEFSTYVAAYEDVEIVVEDAEESEIEAKAETPETGANTQNNSGMIVSLLGCMVTGIVAALMMLPKIRKYLDNRKA